MKGLIRTIICLRNISINTLHKVDDDDYNNDDSDNNNNNNNNNTAQRSDEGADMYDNLSRNVSINTLHKVD